MQKILRNGFTLIEMVATFAIFTLLTGILFLAFDSYTQRTDTKKVEDTHTLLNRLLTQYYKDHIRYQTEEQVIELSNRIYPNPADINMLKNPNCLKPFSHLTNLDQIGWQANNSTKVSAILNPCP